MIDSAQKSPSRPTTIAEMQACLQRLVTADGMRRARRFRPRPGDLFISPYSKCGTTWMQQIVHGLRTRGSMDFDEITGVIPWLELAHDMRIDLHAPQVAPPRTFKSHLAWDEIPKGGAYICVIRDPLDVLVSLYHFFEGWMFEPGTITIAQFAREGFMQRPASRGYWHHLASWWVQRRHPDVLLLCYEDMKNNPAQTVARVAAHMEIELDAELEETVLAQASIEFMYAHGAQFDDHLVRQARDAACGLPPGARTSKVRAGRSGGHRHELDETVVDEMNQVWRKELTPRFDFSSYADLRQDLAESR